MPERGELHPAPSATASRFFVPGMDCPTEAALVRSTLGNEPSVYAVQIELATRSVRIVHTGAVDPLQRRLLGLGFGGELIASGDAAAEDAAAEDALQPQTSSRVGAGERRALQVVLAINAVMFGVEFAVGWRADSSGLLADSLDMFADACVYGISLAAVARQAVQQRRAAGLAGVLQLALWLGIVLELAHNALYGSEPQSWLMMGMAAVALAANVVCLFVLREHRESGAHLAASWLFTSTDVLANAGVIAAGALVLATGSALPDLLVGAAIAALVLRSALKILRLARDPTAP